MPRRRRVYKRDKNGRFARTSGGSSSGPKAIGRTTRGVRIDSGSAVAKQSGGRSVVIPVRGAALAANAVGAATGNPKSQKKLLGKLLGRLGGQAKKNRIEGTVTVTGESARYVVTVRRDPYGRHKSKKKG